MREKLKKVKLLACDFDGIFTDSTVYINQDGVETVRCSRKDGLGIELLKRHRIAVHVISKETNPVVQARCTKLQIACDQAVSSSDGKVEILQRIMKTSGLQPDEIAFVGDDLNDVTALQFAGVAITVADAHPRVKELCDYITQACGGQHAVREIAEMILKARGVVVDKF